MYKTLAKKIFDFNDEKEKADEAELEKIQNKIKKYEAEMIKIRRLFPQNF